MSLPDAGVQCDVYCIFLALKTITGELVDLNFLYFTC